VAIVGPGNLARSLVPNLQRRGIRVEQVFSRSQVRAEAFAQQWQVPQAAVLGERLAPGVSWVLLTVSDAAIAPVAAQMAQHGQPAPGCILTHTSGSTPIHALQAWGSHIGVFYPLQMFTAAREVDLQTVPLFIEGSEATYPTLEAVARRLSPQVWPLDSEQRLRMHLGAVWVANFPNHLYRLAQRELDHAGLPFEVYRALLSEQLRRVFELGPDQTQTGPALRGDTNTLTQHLDLLQDQPEYQALYWQLSRLINPELPPLSQSDNKGTEGRTASS
jgi:predicted short-subunit dehydrogenase-like oxidoreductase (DUF2520 family)